jgi:hypothetical protein
MTLIRAYGEFWRKEMLNLQEREDHGQARLPGKISIRGKVKDVDVWKQEGIYVLFSDYRPVYVGQASGVHMGLRLRDHLHDRHAGRWDKFSWYGLRDFKKTGDRGVLEPGKFARRRPSEQNLIDTLEAVGIAITGPSLNRKKESIPGAKLVQPGDVERGLTTEGQLRVIYRWVREEQRRRERERERTNGRRRLQKRSRSRHS